MTYLSLPDYMFGLGLISMLLLVCLLDHLFDKVKCDDKLKIMASLTKTVLLSGGRKLLQFLRFIFKKMIEIFMTKSAILAGVIAAISLLLTAAGILPNPSPIVSTENGQVQGRVEYSRNGSKYFAYLSIPFAEPPVGNLRFESPKPFTKTWTGVRQSTRYPPYCLQLDAMVRGRLTGKEDCLYLNVFTHGTEGKKPVMVYLHGGGFMSGSSSMYQPLYIMDHSIVLVTINYRLGPLGFMNFEDIRGNMGLKDQNLALKWVQKNIESFGGDAGKVTLFGESAGAASVEYHTLSPLSKGLFHRAILQSGSTLCPWSFMKNPREVSMKYIKMLECPLDNIPELMQCLKTMDPMKLVKLQQNLMHPVNDFLMFVPSAELETTEEPFLTENPRKLLKAGRITNKVPVLFGVTSGEGALRTARLDAVPEAIPALDGNWESLAPRILVYDNLNGSRSNVAGKVRNFYFGNSNFTENLHEFKKNFSKMASDALFFEPIHRAAKLHAQQGQPTYMYYYDYNSVLLPSMYSLFRAVRDDDWIFAEAKLAWAIIVDWAKENILGWEGPHEFGATHADDLFQLWDVEGLSSLISSQDLSFSNRFVKAFIDFSVVRNLPEEPLQFAGVSWPPIQTTPDEIDGSATPVVPQLHYMLIGTEPKVIIEPFADRIPFWESLQIRDS